MRALFVYKDSAVKWACIPDDTPPYYREILGIPKLPVIRHEQEVIGDMVTHFINFNGYKCGDIAVYIEE